MFMSVRGLPPPHARPYMIFHLYIVNKHRFLALPHNGKRNNMKKSLLKEQIKDAATKVCQTLNALQAIERRFNDDLVDDNGKNMEAEYYALRNAITSLKTAYEDIKDI